MTKKMKVVLDVSPTEKRLEMVRENVEKAIEDLFEVVMNHWAGYDNLSSHEKIRYNYALIQLLYVKNDLGENKFRRK